MTESLEALKKLLGSAVFVDHETLFKSSIDNLRISKLPDAVIIPENENQIGELLKLANKYKIPVTVRGSGSATTGSAVPIKGGWILDTSHWKKIEVDSVSGIAYVECGALTVDVHEAVESEGWFYPPDPASMQYSTIGGNISTNAGGLRGAKYGVTRDYVLGLEGFLPTGEKVTFGAPLKKFASGYNIKDLWIGSEGSLGIITKAILKLIPKPEDFFCCLVAYENETVALDAVENLLKLGIHPSILEFLDRQTVTSTECYNHNAVFPKHPGCALLLVEIDGSCADITGKSDDLINWAKQDSLSYKIADNVDEREKAWSVRRQCSQAMYQLGDTKINEDVVVPLRFQKELIELTEKIKMQTGLATPTFGHAADGNFHVHIMYNRNDNEHKKKARCAIDMLMKKVIEWGGAITGEHGIGLSKSVYFQMQHSEAEIAAMLAIKKALDPNNILNPGKIFEPFDIWKETRVDVKLPWDK